LSGGLAPLLQRAGQKYPLDSSLVQRPQPVRQMTTVAPSEVASRLASTDDDDPALARARQRRAAK
jgi:hypothetical protein